MKRLLFIVVILALSVSAYGQKKLTLDEAIKIALNKNTALIKQQNSLDISKGSVISAWGNLLPSLNLSSSIGWSTSTFNQNQYGQQLSESVTTEARRYQLYASSSVTLFDGLSSWARLSQAQDNLEAAKYNLEKAKQDIVYNTTDYFYSIISAQEQYKVSDENLKYNKKMLEQMIEKNKLGSAPMADVYQWQYNVGNSEYNLINAKNNIDKAKITFLNYLSLDILEEYEFEDPNPVLLSSDSEVENINKLIQNAFNDRKDYQAQMFSLNSTRSSLTTASSNYLPRLTFAGSYGTDANELSKLKDKKAFNASLTLSWGFNVTNYFLFDRGIENAKINIMNAEEDLRNLERTIKSDVKQGIIDYQAALKASEVADANLKSASESKRINTEKYNLGSGTILDVLNSDNSYLQAAYNKINQKFQLYRSKDRLMKALGKLDYQKYE